jgi:hypothetical protein
MPLRTYFHVSEEMQMDANVFKVMFGEPNSPENMFDLNGNEFRRASVEVVNRTKLSLTPDRCYELDNVLEKAGAEKDVKL